MSHFTRFGAILQFKEHEKHPWGSVILKVTVALLKQTLFHGCFSIFFNFSNCTNVTKSRKASKMSFTLKINDNIT